MQFILLCCIITVPYDLFHLFANTRMEFMIMEVSFSSLSNAELIVDTVYKGGTASGKASEVLHLLLPKCMNSGGFRKVMRQDGSGLPAYVVLYTSMAELEWPDYLDVETGIFRYYGDNRSAGQSLTATPKGGNILLEEVFGRLNSNERKDIPPFLIFKKTGIGWDVQFLGLAAPGNPKISPDKDLVAFWRSIDGNRFQNYESYFTVLNTESPISREWLNALIYDHEHSIEKAPLVWKRFIQQGRNGIEALKAKRIISIPTAADQMQSDAEGLVCLDAIRAHYKDNPFGFEFCAKDIIEKADNRFQDFELTRPWRDGGRDALGYYVLQGDSHKNNALRIDCALEAKCYGPRNGVGVKQMSRLISRIRYRQCGIMVTTSYVDSQAYSEVVEDGHPILIVSASDIAATLRKNAITSTNIDEWFRTMDSNDLRFTSYSI